MMEVQEQPAVQGASFAAQQHAILRAHIRALITRLADGTKTRA